MPGLEALRIQPSNIHGYGMVTLRAFKKGEVLVYGDGVLYRDHDEFDDTYALILPGYEATAAGEEGPPLYYDLVDQTRWINHSCDPNTEIDSSWTAETKTIRAWWLATRVIAAGEELTYDYAFAGAVAERCYCGSPQCRGVIVDPSPEELAEVPAALRAFLAPQFR